MKGIFIIILLIPAVVSWDSSDVAIYALKVQGCISKSFTEAEKACESSSELNCFFRRGLMLGKTCLKPALSQLLISFGDPVMSKSFHDIFLCSLDLSLDKVITHISGMTDEWISEDENISEEKEIEELIGVVALVFEHLASALKECNAPQHNHVMHEL